MLPRLLTRQGNHSIRGHSAFRLVYISALSLVAILVIGMQFQLGTTLGKMSDDSRVINVAGRQRMLSQRISGKYMELALAMKQGDTEKIQTFADILRHDLSLWRESHEGLVTRNSEQGLSGKNSVAVKKLFAELTPHYGQVVMSCERLLKQVTADGFHDQPSNSGSEIDFAIADHADAFLPIMNQIVNEYDEGSSTQVGLLQTRGYWFGGAILFILLLEAYFLFEPMLRRQLRHTKKLEELSVAAQRASKTKTDFLANMSHEIRTPMTAIIGFSDLLLDPASTESDKHEAGRTIRRNGHHLLSLINDILDVSKIEAGKLEMESISTPIRSVLNDATQLLSDKARDKGNTLSIAIDGLIPEKIRTDPTRLKQALINLMGNAIKFTENGNVRVTASHLPEAGQLEIAISDSGIGMTDEQIGQLFKAFSQADSSTTRKFGGTGLGLMITRNIAQMLGGDVVVSSEPGRGSTFTLTIATGDLTGVQLVTASDCSNSHVAVPNASTSNLPAVAGHVLLVEDGVDNQRLISHILKKAGATVTLRENGKEGMLAALEALERNEPYDLVLMDMQMPVMSGYEAAGELRARGYSGQIVALTANAMNGEMDKCLEAGCDYYLTKPIERSTFIREIAKRSGKQSDWLNRSNLAV